MLRLIIGVVVAAALGFIAFVCGFSQYPSAETSTDYAVLVGVASSAAWAAAAICASQLEVPSNILNLFAALFAAASLGYLTDANSFCIQASDQPAWQGRNWFFELQCRLRYFPRDVSEQQKLAGALRYDERVITRALARIAALERRIETIGPIPSLPSLPQAPPPSKP